MAMSPAAARVDAHPPSSHPPHVPNQPAERGAWAIAGALAVVGALALIAALSGLLGGASAPTSALAPPPVRLTSSLAGAGGLANGQAEQAAANGAIVGAPSAAQQSQDAARFASASEVQIAARWVAGFYPIYAVAQETFAVNWLLLASVHMQESAFSTAAGIYHGLNFAHCCGGPMQFNVRNGPPSTWQLVSDSYLYGRRPAVYDHMTRAHPSIYDDFDSIMAAARLLSADGAGFRLDGTAWSAAFDYYGHDLTGVTYADQVLARAIGWSQHGFCFDCAISANVLQAVDAAYGAPVAGQLEAAARPPAARRPVRRPARVPRAGA
jgi:hypothetical protein